MFPAFPRGGRTESEAIPVCASLPSSLLRRAAALVLAAALVCPVLPQAFAAETFPWSGITYIVTRLEDDPLLIDGSGPAPDLAGYPLTILQNGRSRDLATAARQELTIHHEGQTFTDDSKLEPITVTLRRLGIQPSPIEGVLIQISRGSIEITVASDLVYWERDAVETPYQTIRRANPAMAKGEEDVVQVGSIGEKGGVYEVVWSNGAELSRQLVEELDSEPVDEIIEYGTAVKPAAARPAQAASVSVSRDAESSGESGTLTLSNGETLRFSKAISMTATAYTAGHGGVGTRTASGTAVREGVVAVDRRVIPLGTKLYIVANGGVVYGHAVAEDTGVRGNRIDLYFDTYEECIQFGRRDCMVYILE